VKAQDWIFSVRYWEPRPGKAPAAVDRWAVVGPARALTAETALHLAGVPEAVRAEIRAHQTVRDFIDGRLDPNLTGYYVQPPASPTKESEWLVCIGPVHEVIR
jgi:hypothetical protein